MSYLPAFLAGKTKIHIDNDTFNTYPQLMSRSLIRKKWSSSGMGSTFPSTIMEASTARFRESGGGPPPADPDVVEFIMVAGKLLPLPSEYYFFTIISSIGLGWV